MEKLNPYLTFSGNCEEAFNFYKSVFGGEFLYFGRFSDIPSDDCASIPDYKLNKIMHVALPIGKETILMGSDSGEDWGSEPVTMGNNVSLALKTETREDADRVFESLCSGGTMNMQIGDVFWGSYFGICTDKFGIHWMISYDKKEEELE